MGACEYGTDPFLVPVYRFWSPVNKRHFYTIKASEKQKLIDSYSDVWTYEGIAFYSLPDASEPNSLPVYRFWSPKSKAHFYTINENEKNKLISQYADIWTFEGPAFYAYPDGRQPPDANASRRRRAHAPFVIRVLSPRRPVIRTAA